jgi:hypothetical protein
MATARSRFDRVVTIFVAQPGVFAFAVASLADWSAIDGKLSPTSRQSKQLINLTLANSVRSSFKTP